MRIETQNVNNAEFTPNANNRNNSKSGICVWYVVIQRCQQCVCCLSPPQSWDRLPHGSSFRLLWKWPYTSGIKNHCLNETNITCPLRCETEISLTCRHKRFVSSHVSSVTHGICYFRFIKLEEEERRFIQHRIQTNKPRGQHSGLWENPEVKDRTEVSEGSIRWTLKNVCGTSSARET